MSLDVKVEEQVDGVLVVLDGEMDTHTARTVGEQLNQAPGTRSPNVVIDAAALRFLDSSGISELLRLRQRAVDDGGSLVLRSASPTVRRVLEITGLVELLGLD